MFAFFMFSRRDGAGRRRKLPNQRRRTDSLSRNPGSIKTNDFLCTPCAIYFIPKVQGGRRDRSSLAESISFLCDALQIIFSVSLLVLHSHPHSLTLSPPLPAQPSTSKKKEENSSSYFFFGAFRSPRLRNVTSSNVRFPQYRDERRTRE